jgi:predicted metal-binding protein
MEEVLAEMDKERLEKYVKMAGDLGMVHALWIGPQDFCFDRRAVLKCRWGCGDYSQENPRCSTRGTSFEERVAMVKDYMDILLLHCHDAHQLSKAVLEIERSAFLDGYYFAFAIRACNLCAECVVQRGGTCPTPEKIRPCDQSFGIDVYKTARELGLPCEPLQNPDDLQNRYGFVLIE